MNILLADATAFGAFPKEKNNMLSNVYLITAEGETPTTAEQAVFMTCHNAFMAIEASHRPAVTKHLNSKKATVWMIDTQASSGKSTPVQWKAFDDNSQNDYYIEEQAALKARFKNEFPWALPLRHSECLAHILGISPFNFRTVSNKPANAKGTTKPASRFNSAALAYMENVINDYQGSNITISTEEAPIGPLVDAYNKVGQDHVDEAGYLFQKVRVEASRITKHGSYLVRHNAPVRYQTTERSRRGHDSVVLKDPMLRAKVNDEWIYFTHVSMPKSAGLAEVLAKAYPKTIGKSYARLLQEDRESKPSMKMLFGENMQILHREEVIEAIRGLTVEGLTLSGEWKPIDLTVHNEELIGKFLISTFSEQSRYTNKSIDISRKDAYASSDAYLAKKALALRDFGHISFANYLLHPLHEKHKSFREDAHHYYWMKWCKQNDVVFME